MTMNNMRRGALGGLILAGVVAAGMAGGSTAAMAGQCPADKIIADATKPVDFKPKDVTDTVLGSIDLSKEPANIQGRQFRMRKLTIKKGGIVPWHSHGDRPAIIYIVKGEVIEHASNCAVPIVHKAGDVAVETAGVSHWWENKKKTTVELISADLLADPKDTNM